MKLNIYFSIENSLKKNNKKREEEYNFFFLN
jgi:hypothetical protein